jgi:hypothetical protein
LFRTAKYDRVICGLLLPERLLGVIERAFAAVAGTGYDLPGVEPDPYQVPPGFFEDEADLSDEGPSGLPGDKADLSDDPPEPIGLEPDLIDFSTVLFRGHSVSSRRQSGFPKIPGHRTIFVRFAFTYSPR